MLLRAVIAVLCLAVAGCGGSSQPRFVVGTVDDAAKYAPDPAGQMHVLRDSGLDAVVLSAVWRPAASADTDLPALRRAVRAATDADVRPVLAVYQFSSATPLDATGRSAFAGYAAGLARGLPDVRDVIVGNEPNLNLFWQPQFDQAGGDVAARDFERLLAVSYDALKSVDEKLNVIGGGLAPHGGDRPSSRPTHSPTRFLNDLGDAYRQSGRTRPLMDALSIHVYGESSRVPPTLAHPRTTTIGIADYARLVGILAKAFDGTAQAGRKLPIVYGEYGAETTVPSTKRALYTGHEVVPTVDEATQARYYAEAIRLAREQKNVRMLLFFHVADERRLEGLQSGLRYVDGTPKRSLSSVRDAAGSDG
jgi:hypothetical protein